MELIRLNDVWLKYRIEFKENGKLIPEDFWSLHGINLSIQSGETVAVIGENGAGKSTLLRVIAGMLKSDRGTVTVSGKVAGLIDIGSGFHKDLTGKENIYLLASLFGLTDKEIESRFDSIVSFASIGRFINAPVKSYSQGMFMRLGFAIAAHIDTDILLIDETFVVGDMYAQRKCINKIFELKESGRTIIFVSHDLDIAKRVCARGILLREGRIIKDGPIEQVCDYYRQTVGDKKGIALLERGPLGLVFNNGKLILRWKDNAITSHMAGHSTMTMSGRQYSSILADWQIQEIGGAGKGIVATARWPDTKVSQQWRLIFLNDRELLWEVIADFSEEITPERSETTILFTEGYRRWFSLDKEYEFPKIFLHEEQWQCETINDAADSVIGLKGDAAGKEFLPTVVFDRLQGNQKMRCHIGNTGSTVGTRALQYILFPQGSSRGHFSSKYLLFHSKIVFFDASEEDKLRDYLKGATQLQGVSTVIRGDALSVFCRDHKVEIYWEGNLITRETGFNTQFRYLDKSYNSKQAAWEIHKVNDREMVLSITWDDIPALRQIWRISLDDGDIVKWQITQEASQELKIINWQTELLLSEEYSQWFTAEESGEFDKLEKKGGVVILNKYTNNCMAVAATAKTGYSALQKTIFNCLDNWPMVSYIFRVKNGTTTTTKLQYLKIDSEQDIFLKAGKTEYFSGSIEIGRQKASPDFDATIRQEKIKPPTDNREVVINNGCLKLTFSNGKGRIFWRDTELTKRLGLYSSVFLWERWHDSSQAHWEAFGLTKEKLRATGLWPWVPMKQIWEIEIMDSRTILVRIERKIWDRGLRPAEREQVGLMVSDYYREWFSSRQGKLKFPLDFVEHNGFFWERLWCGSAANPIGVEKAAIRKDFLRWQNLPTLLFEASVSCHARHSIVENTDNLFLARVLQYEMAPQGEGTSVKKIYFEGRIKIGG